MIRNKNEHVKSLHKYTMNVVRCLCMKINKFWSMYFLYVLFISEIKYVKSGYRVILAFYKLLLNILKISLDFKNFYMYNR